MKLTNKVTKYLNTYTSLPLCIQPNLNSPMLTEDNNVSDYFIYYNREKLPLDNKGQDVEKE